MSKLQNKYKNLNEADAKSEFYKAGVKAFNKGLYQRDNPYTDSAEKKDWDDGWVFTMQKTATSSGNKKKLNESNDFATDWDGMTVSEREDALYWIEEDVKYKDVNWEEIPENVKKRLQQSIGEELNESSRTKVSVGQIIDFLRLEGGDGKVHKYNNTVEEGLEYVGITKPIKISAKKFIEKYDLGDEWKTYHQRATSWDVDGTQTFIELKKEPERKKYNSNESNNYPKDKPLSDSEAEKAWDNASVQQREKLLYEYNNGKDFVEEWKNCEWEDDLHHSIKTIVKTGYKTESLFEDNSPFEPKKFASDNDIDGYDLATIIEKSKNTFGSDIYDFSVNLIGKEKSDLLMPYLGVKLNESFDKGSYKGKFRFLSGLDDYQIRELCLLSKTENESPNRTRHDKSRFEGEIEVFANTGDFGTNFYNKFSDEQRQDLLNCIETYAKQNNLNESNSDDPKNGDRIRIIDGEYSGKEAFVEFVDVENAIKKVVVNLLPNGGNVTIESGQFVNLEESKKLFENKETLTKSDLANVLSLNAVNGRKFSDSDISDDILSKFNSKWSSIHKTNPSFDPFGLDVEMEDADVFDDFMDLIVSLSKSDSKVSLFENSKAFEKKKLSVLSSLYEKNSNILGSKTGKEFVKLNEGLKGLKNKIKEVEKNVGEKPSNKKYNLPL